MKGEWSRSPIGKGNFIKSKITSPLRTISVVDPDQPATVTESTDCHVNPSELLTKNDTGLTTTATNLDLGEGEEGEYWEEEEGGMVGDDLESGLTAKIDGGEDGQETLRDEHQGYTECEFGIARFILLL